LRIRDKAIQNLGGKCTDCGATEYLHLHHITYAKDSVRASDKSDDSRRAKEAFEHPERFMLLCKTCHMKLHDIRNKPRKVRRLTKEEVEEFDRKHPEYC